MPAPREHDLPVTWDGHPVTWRGWTTVATTLQFHLPLDDLACRRCGSLNEHHVNSGTVALHGAREVERLAAFRCPDCHHDQVLELDTDRLWDLDETDYGAGGSVHPGPAADPSLDQVAFDVDEDLVDEHAVDDPRPDVRGESEYRDLPAPPIARSFCHGCGQLIVWATTVASPSGAGGKLQPFDVREDPAGNVAITQPTARGRLLARALCKGESVSRPLEYVAMTHFASCPANAHPAPPIALLEHQTKHLARRPGGRR